MATVIGRTSNDILDLVSDAIVSGVITETGRLLLTAKDGTIMDLGSVGGSGNTRTVEFTFATPITTWTCSHNLGHLEVDVTTFDNNGDEIFGDVSYVDDNTVMITWYYELTGVAIVQR